LRKLRSRLAIEKKRSDAEQAMNGAQSQTESHRNTLSDLQASCDLKIARKAALEAELRSLSAEIEADKKRIAELPGLIKKTQEETHHLLQCPKRLPRIIGQFPSGNIQCSWSDCETSEHLNASIAV
jgi:predicted  nucleic acid-binding Zn-ribbon protein